MDRSIQSSLIQSSMLLQAWIDANEVSWGSLGASGWDASGASAGLSVSEDLLGLGVRLWPVFAKFQGSVPILPIGLVLLVLSI